MLQSNTLSTPKPGAVLKALRTERGWTLNDVSARTGIAASTLSKVENDKMSLTYDKLTRLSEGLEVDIVRLFGTASSDEPSPDLSLTGRRSISRDGQGSAIDTPNYAHLYLAADVLHKKIVPIIADLKARTLEEFGELIRHPGEEYAFIVEGTVEFHSDLYTPVILNKGDSIYFDSGMGHAYLAAAPGLCRVLSVCSNLSMISPPGALGGEDVPREKPKVLRAS